MGAVLGRGEVRDMRLGRHGSETVPGVPIFRTWDSNRLKCFLWNPLVVDPSDICVPVAAHNTHR
jgi:hypothetical protein